MSDFKGRKDFPEVADNKIKIGDYSGTNRLSVTDIYSPKAEPELRDQIMEPVKGKTNNYDSPILSQQPVITLSDTDSEAALIRAINGYVAKQGDSFSDVEEGFSEPKRKEPREEHPSRAHDEEASPRQRRKPRRNPQAKDYQKSDFEKVKVPVPQGELKPAGGDAPKPSPLAGPKFDVGDPRDKRAGAAAPSQATVPKPPTPASGHGAGPSTGGAGGPKVGSAGEQAGKGLGIGGKLGGLGRGLGRLGRGAAGFGARGTEGVARMGAGMAGGAARYGSEQVGAMGRAAKIGAQQGIRTGRAREEGPAADVRRAGQADIVHRNPLTAGAAMVGRKLAGGSKFTAPVRGAARAAGFGRTDAENQGMRSRYEYADDEEMALSDILNELETYMANEQPNNSMVERQMTKGNISKMMRNTEEKAPRDWKYHV
jgi:hypothetical protein